MRPDDVEQPSVVERVDEHRRVDLVAQQEVSGHPHAGERDAVTAGDLHRDDRQRDGDAGSPAHDLVEERVARVVVRVAVAGEPHVAEEQPDDPGQGRVAHLAGDAVDGGDLVVDVEIGVRRRSRATPRRGGSGPVSAHQGGEARSSSSARRRRYSSAPSSPDIPRDPTGTTVLTTMASRFAFLDHPGPVAFAHRGGAATNPENTWAPSSTPCRSATATSRPTCTPPAMACSSPSTTTRSTA